MRMKGTSRGRSRSRARTLGKPMSGKEYEGRQSSQARARLDT